jgi:hypothetical protein
MSYCFGPKGVLLLFFSSIFALLQIGCSKDQELRAAQYEFKLREQHLIELEAFTVRSSDVEKAILSEEEKLIALAAKIHAMTGSDATIDYVHGSGAYNAYLVVTKRPEISSFSDVPKEKRPPLIDDRLRSVPDVISVKLIRRVDAHQPNRSASEDPLSLFSDNPALQSCLKDINPTDPLGLRTDDTNQAKQRRLCMQRFGK